jgi:hypothetical protein
MSRCKDVISQVTWKRHTIDAKTNTCKRCLQPAFQKQKRLTALARLSKSFAAIVFPGQLEIAEEIMTSTTEIGGGMVAAEITRDSIPEEFGGTLKAVR